NIPYILHQKIEDKNEAYYHILFLSWMKLMGFDIQGEIQTFKGRIDAVLKQKDEVVVIEIKYGKKESVDKLLNETMEQIEKKEYYQPYQDKNITLLAIAFKEKEVGCKIKQI
ncbi:MAG: PD-(D/E)XK nuclease domain-containing protein, partial [Methanobrevibacter sp.]|nr:PD-(D/E)XK nuclease domain-containing protein [Candidatus Methanoflexus mossambicus]